MAILFFWLLTLMPASAQTPDQYRARADQLLTVLKAPGDEEAFFASLFLNAIPIDQWRGLTQSLRAQYGDPQGIAHIMAENSTSAIVDVDYARAIVSISLVLSPEPPHKAIGLRIIGTKAHDDNAAKLIADFATLPGHAALNAVRLTDSGPLSLFGLHQEDTQAVGSEYKLYILAELARSIKAGERRWGDVVPLDRKSFSGRLSAWPNSAPMTLHSLATAMISESDNSAADTLLFALGREKVDAMVGASGHAAPSRMLPILSTIEAFALKQKSAEALRKRYAVADTKERRALLGSQASLLTRERIDIAQVADRPVAIDSIEWFASPDDMIHLLDLMRRTGGDALPIMAVNPGIGAGDAARWAYLGYKGGSEPGVMAMSFLGRTQDDQWVAVSGSWNDTAASIDNDRFVALMTRALNLIVAPTRSSLINPSTPRPAP